MTIYDSGLQNGGVRFNSARISQSIGFLKKITIDSKKTVNSQQQFFFVCYDHTNKIYGDIIIRILKYIFSSRFSQV